MGEPEAKSSSAGGISSMLFSAPGIALLVAITSFILGNFNFRLARPVLTAESKTIPADPLRRESRIWQDPTELLPTELSSADSNKFAGYHEAAEVNWRSLRSEMLKKRPASGTNESPENAILFVVDHPSPYSHGVESRLRTRTAVLDAMREVGLTKKSPDQTDFVLLDASLEMDATNARSEHLPEAPKPLPYEIFRNDTIGPNPSAYNKVLVFWISERDLARSPWLTFHAVLNKLVNTNFYPNRLDLATNRPSLKVGILGPRTSDGLWFFTRDEATSTNYITNNGDDAWRLLNTVNIISSAARCPDSFFPYHTNTVLLPARLGVQWALNRQLLKNATVSQYGATDDQLCFALAAEMKLRGINVASNSVLLFSEYDTVYGRSLPLTFEAAVQALQVFHPYADTNVYAARFYSNRISQTYLDSPVNALDLLQLLRLAEGNSNHARLYSDLLSVFTTNLDLIKSNENFAPKNILYFTYLAGLDGSKTPPDDSKKTGEQLQQKTDGSIDTPTGDQQLDYIKRLAYSFSLRARTDSTPYFSGIGDVRAVGLLGSDPFDKMLMMQALKEQLPNCCYFTTELDSCYTIPSQTAATRNLILASGFDLLPPQDIMTNSRLRFTPFRDSSSTAQFVGCVDFLKNTSSPQKSSLGIYEVGRSAIHPLPLSSHLRVDRPWHWLNMLWHKKQLWDSIKSRTTTLYHLGENTLGSPALLAGAVICFIVVIAAAFPSRHTVGMSWVRFLAIIGLTIVLLALILVWLFNDSLEPIEVVDGVSALPSTLLVLLVYPVCLFAIYRSCKSDDSENVSNTPAFSWTLAGGLLLYTIMPLFEILRVPAPVRSLHPFSFATCVVFAWVLTGLLCVIASSFSRSYLKKMGELVENAKSISSDPYTVPDFDVPFYDLMKEAEETSRKVEETASLPYYPMIALLLLTIAHSSLLDSWHLTAGLLAISIFGVLIVLVPLLLVQRRAAQFKRVMTNRLAAQRIAASRRFSSNKDAVEAINVKETVLQNLNSGCFAPFTQQPVWGAVAALIGGSGLVSVLQQFLSR